MHNEGILTEEEEETKEKNDFLTNSEGKKTFPKKPDDLLPELPRDKKVVYIPPITFEFDLKNMNKNQEKNIVQDIMINIIILNQNEILQEVGKKILKF